MPASYGRREWALAFGAQPEKLQSTAGHIGLNEYKNWVLNWPERTKPADYPRALISKAEVAEVAGSVGRHPDRDSLAKFYLVSEDKDHALAHAKQVIHCLPSANTSLGNWNLSGLSHYRQSETLMQTGFWAEDALACPVLPAEIRRDLRRELAVTAYLLSNPDVNPRGAGVHLGNNNMSINRTCALAYFAGLLPDHPLHRQWMNDVTAFVAYKMGSWGTGWDLNAENKKHFLARIMEGDTDETDTLE